MRVRRGSAAMAVLTIGISGPAGIQFGANWVMHGLGDLRTDANGVVLVWGILVVFLMLRTAIRDKPKQDIPQRQNGPIAE
jgi:hypothetical protein